MNDTIQRVAERLEGLGFSVQHGSFVPFGEELPLVTTVAWDLRTAQLALIAEMRAQDSDASWRQLLFAASGLRHQLAGDGPSSFGTPLVLAIVDADGERRLRRLTEDLSENYALFNRVDLNLVRDSAARSDAALDMALAPLLPHCRTTLADGLAISHADVVTFWKDLRAGVLIAATKAATPIFAPFVADAATAAADALIGNSQTRGELPPLVPAKTMRLRNFRSFVDQEVQLAAATVVHGPNGGGKTSVVEGLEIGWAGRSQRQPAGVAPSEYARHLNHDGAKPFTIDLDTTTLTELRDHPNAELSRSVLDQDALGELVSKPPDQRYAALLTMTGLEIPELAVRSERLVRDAKAEADVALAAAGLAPLPAISSVALNHLRRQLGGGFADRLPSAIELTTRERAVSAACGGAFAERDWDDSVLETALSRADAEIATVLEQDGDARAIAVALDAVASAARTGADRREVAATAGRALLAALGLADGQAPAIVPPAEAPKTDDDLPAGLAVRWLSHRRSLMEGAARFRNDATTLDDPWRTALTTYAAALEGAADQVPLEQLEPLARAAPLEPPRTKPPTNIEAALFVRAGFVGAVPDPQKIRQPLTELIEELDRQTDALSSLSADVERHPTRHFIDHGPRVMRALCRFEVARTIRREDPASRASERLLETLLQGRLAPVLRELTAAIVRFEWYFKPLQLTTKDRQIVLGGLGTSQPDLDARLTLNSAERTVVGVAWFLALHMLQPPERRRVLVLDDPTGAFDLSNQAGFISTLRAYARLTRPDQIVVTTHDDTLAAMLAEELAPVDGWPSSVGRIRCRRNDVDESIAECEPVLTTSRDLYEECQQLRLKGGPLPSKG